MGSTVLVTGGAGYVGSHTCKALAKHGYEPVVYDNLYRGHRESVLWGPLVEADLADRATLEGTLRRFRPVAVLHFAGYTDVAESISSPELYFSNNAVNSFNLFNAILKTENPIVVFSSSAAVYGLPDTVPVVESMPKRPISPYGESKLVSERMLHWLGLAHGVRQICLRYFNAAGADPDGEIGERHDPETHLIPLVLDAIVGRRSEIKVYGTDYPTPDGTAIRDYIHVQDLAEAHVRALEYLIHGGSSTALNIGSGNGHSVREVISVTSQVTNRRVPHVDAPRRDGDPPVLVADSTQAQTLLQWMPTLSGLESIIETAWRWHVKDTTQTGA